MTRTAETSTAEVAEVVGVLRPTVVALARRWRRDGTGEFSPTELILLGAIDRNAPIALNRLAVLERMSAPTVSRVVHALEQRGVVERLSSHDRRVSRVRLSRRGTAMVNELNAEGDREFAERLATLSAEQLAVVAQAVPLLRALLTVDDEQ